MAAPTFQAQPDVADPNGLLTLGENGSVPKSRIKNSSTANSIASSLWYSDQSAAFDRSLVDAQCDGFCPMDQGDLRANGLGNSTNVNFLGSMGKEEVSMSSYNNMAMSSERLIRVEMPKAPKEKKMEWEQIFSEEFTRLHRFDWPNFVPNMQYVAKGFIRHGVSVIFRSSEWDWRWSVSRLGDFQVQRRQNCSVDDVELAIQRSFENPNVVYSWIEDEESAKDSGWNIKATKLAIQNAVIPLYNSYGTNGIDPEMWERDAKENSFFWTQGKAKQVELRHFWVKEFDGSVTHLITTPENDEDFLFERKGRWDSMTSCFVFFTYGIGNGDIYSIRGLGWKLFGSEQLKNVLLCKMANSTMMSLGTVWKPTTPEGSEDFQSITWGDFTIAPSGFDVVPIQWPNMTASGIPFLNMIGAQQSANTGTYTPTPNLVGNDVEKTAKQYQGEAAQQAVLSTSAADLFYQSLDRVHQMTVRALLKEPYPEVMPGGKERAMFIKRLTDRGLTMEAIQSTCCVRAIRTIGAGSESMRRSKIANLVALSQQFDPVGRRQALRLAAMEEVGIDNVDTFLPTNGERIPDDKKVAELEANSFMFGIIPEVMENENSEVHLAEHFQFIDAQFAKLDQRQIQPPQAVEYLGTALEHTKSHIAQLSDGVPEESNTLRRQVIKQVSIRQQQYEAQLKSLVVNTQRQIQSDQEAQAQQQAKMSADALDAHRKDAIAKANIQRADEIALASIERENTRLENSLLIERAKANSSIETSVAKSSSELEQKSIFTEQEILSKTRKTQQDLAIKDVLLSSDLDDRDS